jgi:hypothetical protein
VNNFTLCAHDIIKLVLVFTTLSACVGAFSAAMCLVAKYGSA